MQKNTIILKILNFKNNNKKTILNNLIKTWPVVIFILRRKDKVIGRINTLTNSTIFNKKINHKGLPEGVKWLKNITGWKTNDETTINNQTKKDMPMVNTNWVVNPKTKGNNPKIFKTSKMKKSDLFNTLYR